MVLSGFLLLASTTFFFLLNGYLLLYDPGHEFINLFGTALGFAGIVASFFIISNSMRQ